MNFGAFLSTGFLNKLKAVFGKTLYQEKVMSANQTTNGDIADLTFNNLEAGKKYRLTGGLTFSNTGDDGNNVQIFNGATQLIFLDSNPNAGGGTQSLYLAVSTVFTASADTLTFNANSTGANSFVLGNGSRSISHMILEELPNHEETTKFS